MSETIFCHERKSHLSISGHSKADKPLVKYRSLGSGHVERLVFEDVVLHLETNLRLLFVR